MTYFFFSGEEVTSYNDVISISYPIKTDFKAFLKADDFFKVISKLKVDDILFKMSADVLQMKAGKVLSSFATIYDEEIVARIATVKKSSSGGEVKKLPSDFIESIRLCSQVASKNESDQLLTCVSIKGKDVLATDNIRIAHAPMKKAMDEMLIKASEIRSLISINPTTYIAEKSWVHFMNDAGCMYSIRRSKGDYPDMLRFMKFDGIELSLPKDILDGVDIASVFTDDNNDVISITIKNGICQVLKKSSAGSIDYRESIDYKGPDVTFKINPDLLKEMMSHSTSITVAANSAKLETENFTLVTSLFSE